MKSTDVSYPSAYRSRRKAERALTMAVLAALLAGGTSVMAKSINTVTDETNATGNHVEIPAGTTVDAAIAAYTHDTTLSVAMKNNDVTVSGTVNRRAAGANGYAVDVIGNSVTVKDGATVSGLVVGGMTAKGVADSNIVAISGGTVSGQVYGGYSIYSDATNNAIIISGGKITGKVYGGFSYSGAATNNAVILKEGVDKADLTNAMLYGGHGTTTSGNALTIDGGKVSRSRMLPTLTPIISISQPGHRRTTSFSISRTMRIPT